MERREFLRLTGIGMSTLAIPVLGQPRGPLGAVTPVPTADRKMLADVALDTARGKGATYADVRIGRYLNQFIITREEKVQNIVNTESYGCGIRVILDGTWGFAATSQVTKDGIAEAAKRATAIASANSKLQVEPVRLAPVKGVDQISWRTPIEKNPMEIPISEKVDLLMAVNAAAMENGADFINSFLFLVNEQKYFASTDGSYIDQDVYRLWPNFVATGIDKKTGKFQTRGAFSAPQGKGWEYMDGRKSGKIAGVTTLYGSHYDMVEDASAAGRQVGEKLKARTIEPGRFDLVLDPTHLWLTIHESVGHPLELDRVLGYEANYAGTSFATLEKWKTKSFKYGSGKVSIFADKTQRGSLGAVGYDDEGVKCRKWDLIKDGILVNYEAIRDQVHILGQSESHGCCYADSWSSVQFQRMPNVSLEPGDEKLSAEEIIKGTEKGILIIGDGSYSIDQQRYNFQFGGQLFYEIKNGRISGMLRDVAYQANTQEFWNSCVQIADKDDYRLGGSFFCGKGQPSQLSAVSHGCATARFNGINVINTERQLG